MDAQKSLKKRCPVPTIPNRMNPPKQMVYVESIPLSLMTKDESINEPLTIHISISRRIHVLYIYLHVVDFYGKCM